MVANSNHTCSFFLDFGIIDWWCILNKKYGCPNFVRGLNIIAPNTAKKMKLLALISAPYEKLVNIHLLDGVPLELMPKVLEFVQQYPEESNDYPKAWHHWNCMSALRPATPQDANTSDGGSEHNKEDEEQEGEADDLEFVRNEEEGWGSVIDDWPYYDDEDDDEEEAQATSAEIKRLNMLFEILRGWKMETGEPLYLIASIVSNGLNLQTSSSLI